MREQMETRIKNLEDLEQKRQKTQEEANLSTLKRLGELKFYFLKS